MDWTVQKRSELDEEDVNIEGRLNLEEKSMRIANDQNDHSFVRNGDRSENLSFWSVSEQDSEPLSSLDKLDHKYRANHYLDSHE